MKQLDNILVVYEDRNEGRQGALALGRVNGDQFEQRVDSSRSAHSTKYRTDNFVHSVKMSLT